MQRPLPAIAFVVLVALAPPPLPAAEAGGERLPLTDGWTLQTSMQVQAGGAALSMPGFPTAGWYGVRVPNTVVGAMVESGVLSDPYFGMNLRKIPGTTYKIGERFTLIPTPSDSPFRSTWWYRKEFDLPATKAGRPLRLHFDGINYRASIWLNGTRIATAANVAGVFRRYAFDVTKIARVGGKNALAVEVDGPEPRDLAIMWVDWNPTPADKNMGLWGDVYLTDSGPLALKNPHVVSDLDLPSLGAARITVTTEVENATDRPVKGVVKGAVEGIRFSKAVSIPARQTRTVRFTAADTPALDVKNPRIWWPHRMGKPELYTLALEVEAAGAVSDRREVTFGVQEMTSELTDKGHRLFKVNGKPILVKGGGWASDMLLRPITTERALAELRYVKEMGLNTIRLEGKLETDEFYDLADREGVLLMPGWCCCDQWEMWDKWDAEDHRVAPLSLRDQILRMRNHPSVIAWFNGSDFPPPARVERAYLDVLEKLEWSKPVLSNATDTAGPISGPTGVKMRGPYDYVPPPYWLTDTEKGGAFGFATEMGPGGAVPPIESLQRMIPAEHLWPIDEYWKFHAGGDEFKDLNLFTDALEGRYGKATGVEDYARKAQALAYENHRAMFEAFGRNKYTATGVIQWMLNNAWPSMIWHLYDYYLRPGGSYFGTKKAGEPVHVQYSYDDRSVVVVNDLQQGFRRMKVKAEVFDLALKPRFEGEATVDVAADGVARALVIPEIADLTRTYFVRLWLSDEKGALLSRNFYWLSTKKDELDWKNTKWYYTPTTAHADLTALAALPPTTLHVTVARALGDPAASVVTVRNTGPALAFQVRLKMVDAATGEERLPVFWDDNYIELFPGEIRQLRVEHTTPSTAPMQIQVAAWNAPVVFE